MLDVSGAPVASSILGMRIHLPSPLRPFADKQSAVDVTGTTIAEALLQLTAKYPELKRHLFTDDGKVRGFVNVYLNDDDVRYLADKEGTVVKDSDTISILPSIAGG